MLDESLYLYYFTYVAILAMIGVLFLKVKSTEPLTITTKEFRKFQASFLIGYGIMILSDLISVGSFYQIMTSLNLSQEQITKLYVVTVISNTAFGTIFEIIDFGSRRNKCITSAILYTISLSSIYFGGGHFDLLMITRIIYGSASALLHSSFDSYLVHQHNSFGFPDDWLSQTFCKLTHSMAFVSIISGLVGQSSFKIGTLGPITLSCLLFTFVTVFISLSWKNDLNGRRFLLSSFLNSMVKTLKAARTNKQVLGLLVISACSEASITIFTFYWAPWLKSVTIETGANSTLPYVIIFSTYIAASMIGTYTHQLSLPSFGNEAIFQAVSLGLSAAYFLGAVFQTPILVFGISVLVQGLAGVYWPAVGYARGRIILPEMRSASLSLGRILSFCLVAPILSWIHHSPMTVLLACSILNAVAAYFQHTTGQALPFEQVDDLE